MPKYRRVRSSAALPEHESGISDYVLGAAGRTWAESLGCGPQPVVGSIGVTHNMLWCGAPRGIRTPDRLIRSPKPADTLQRPRFVLNRVRSTARFSSIPG